MPPKQPKKGGAKAAKAKQAPSTLLALTHPTSEGDETEKNLHDQEEELESLEAIYGDDFKRLPAVWGKKCFTISVISRLGDDDDAPPSVTVHFALDRAYPRRSGPTVEIKAVSHVAEDRLKELKAILRKGSEKRIGRVMVLDLMFDVQEFLGNIHSRRISFYEEMVQRQEKRKVIEEELRRELSAQQREKLLEEEKALQEAIRADKELREAKARAYRERVKGTKLTEPDGKAKEIDAAQRDWAEEFDEEEEDEEGKGSSPPLRTGSRYFNDFRELELLGRGGFGEVVKAQNRLDKRLYAIKKIKLDPQDVKSKRKILREVTFISRMTHRHIVRYYQAWLEGESGQTAETDSDDDSENSWLQHTEDEDEEGGMEDWFGASTSRSISGLGIASRKPTGRLDNTRLLSTSQDASESDSNSTASEDETESARMNEQGSDSDEEKEDDDSGSTTFKASPTSSDGFSFGQWKGWGSSFLQRGPSKELDINDQFFQVASENPVSPPSPTVLSLPKKSRETLFIQMEYCEGKTLREVIDKGELWKHPEDIWRFFRQAVEATAYIHSKGMIHRDIKPSNVFFDADGNVKLGDFGLATRKANDDDDGEEEEQDPEDGYRLSGAPEGRAETSSISAMLTTVDSITAGVGTAFYRAPEQEREGSKYNQKADMFSLGIVFFEMWAPPFSTGMERAETLTELRQRDNLPKEFVQRVPPNVTQIIHWLCSTNPSLRPTAADLLRSNLMPPKMEVEERYLEEVLETLSNPNGPSFQHVVDALFLQAPRDHVDYTYDSAFASKRKNDVESRVRSLVCMKMQAIFEKHGAIQQETPLLRPASSNWGPHRSSSNSCALLDPNGVVVSLPFDLTEPVARFIARTGLSNFKSYQFDRVFRRVIGGGHPRELHEADFDVVWNLTKGAEVVEAETLMVLSEVLNSIGPQIGPYYIRLNNTKMIYNLLDVCDVSPSSRAEVLRLLSASASTQLEYNSATRTVKSVASPYQLARWKAIHKDLIAAGLSPNVAESLKGLFFLPANPIETSHVLEDFMNQKNFNQSTVDSTGLPLTASLNSPTKLSVRRQQRLLKSIEDAREGLRAMKKLLVLLEELFIDGPSFVLVDLGLTQSREVYSCGLFFRAILLPTVSAAGVLNEQSAKDTVAEGGRYDTLITRYKLPAARLTSNNVIALGLRFAVDKIVSKAISSMMASKKEGMSSARGPAVLICSSGKAVDMLAERLKVARLLWAASIQAEYIHSDFSNLEILEESCVANGYSWIILVLPHLLSKRKVKVRSARKADKSEHAVDIDSLVSFLKGSCGLAVSTEQRSEYDTPPTGRGVMERIGHLGIGGTPVTVDFLESKTPHGIKEKKKAKEATQLVGKKAMKFLDGLSMAGEGRPSRVIYVEAPYTLLREATTAYLMEGSQAEEAIVSRHNHYRRVLKSLFETLDGIAADGESKARNHTRPVLLYSAIDDRYDLVFISADSKLGRSSSMSKSSARKKVPATPPR